jgi:hypothetical protein
MVTLDSVLARRPDPLTAPVDGELVMLDTRKSLYFGLDHVGRRVWELLAEPQSVAALCGTLEREFDVTRETCRTDVVAFLERLREQDLVEVR